MAQDEQSNTFLDDHNTRQYQVGAGYALADITPNERVKLSAGAPALVRAVGIGSV